MWRSFLSYNQVNSVATDGTTFYAGTNSGFFTYNRADGAMTSYSKANGMSDIGLSYVAYDKLTGYTVLAYRNSNIDLFNGTSFTNIPEIVLSSGSGNKAINGVMAHEGRAYLSTNLGLVILNLNKKEVKETIHFYDNSVDVPFFATMIDGNFLYASTEKGLYRINVNSPSIQFQAQWEAVNTTRMYHYLAKVNGEIYAAEADSLFKIIGTNATLVEKLTYPIKQIDACSRGIWVSTARTTPTENGRGLLLNNNGEHIDSIITVSPSQILELANGEVWFGDNSRYPYISNHGLRKRTSATVFEPYFPSGPITTTSFDVSAYNGELWVAHGGKNEIWNTLKYRSNFSQYKEGTWRNIPWVDGNENVQDFVRVLKDQNTGKLYAASYSGGLLEMQTDGSWKVYNEGFLSNLIANPGFYFLSGLAIDNSGNLWMTNYGASGTELVVKTRDGQWPALRAISSNPRHTAADVIIDDYNQKWFIAPNGEGVVVYNDNGTLDQSADDRYFALRKGKGVGNLPDNTTSSIAKDKDGAIWIGTASGIGIINCPDQVIDRQCEAELRVVQADQFADYLFSNQAINAIAVDGANRKWIGTRTGVWLISADAKETIYRFTAENSPLPSNIIERINIDPVTGDVYISTDLGLVSFRSTATEGKTENEEELYIYPNPVPSGFGGMIAIRGFAENSDVRITDIAGQLVYRTKALGGQAVWNGKDYTGKKAQSGVYLVFGVNKDGSQKITGKIIVHE